MKNTAKELEEENRDCKTKMADLDKRLKLCRDEMYDLNNTLNKSNKRNLMIQSESTANHKIGPKRPPKKPYSPRNIRIGGGIPHILYLHSSSGSFKIDIYNNIRDVTSIGDTPQYLRSSVAV